MLALIAGGGDLPRNVFTTQDTAPLVCALQGNQQPNGLKVDLLFRLETLGTLLLTLGEMGVTEICLCGAIDRPVLDQAALGTHQDRGQRRPGPWHIHPSWKRHPAGA